MRHDVYTDHATPEELRAVLGERWAICGNTEANRQRYGRCITRGQYQRATAEALKRRCGRIVGRIEL